MTTATARLALLAALGAAACGLVQLGLAVARPLVDVLVARTWVPVAIEDLEAEEWPFHGVAHVHVRYRYVIDGTSYEGRRYAFTTPVDLDLLDEVPTSGWVDPNDPSSAVVIRTVPLGWLRWGGVVPVGIGLVAARSLRRRAPVRAGLGSRALRIVGSALLFVLAGVLFLAVAVNPFAMFDLAGDPVHDPGALIEHVARWSGASLLLAALALTLIDVATPEARTGKATAPRAEPLPARSS